MKTSAQSGESLCREVHYGAEVLMHQGAIALDRERRLGKLCLVPIETYDSAGRSQTLNSYHLGCPDVISNVLDQAGIIPAARPFLLAFTAQPGSVKAGQLSSAGDVWNPDRGGHAAMNGRLRKITEMHPLLTIGQAALICESLGRLLPDDYQHPEGDGYRAQLKGVMSERVVLHLLQAAATAQRQDDRRLKIGNVEPATPFEDLMQGFDGYFELWDRDRRFDAKSSVRSVERALMERRGSTFMLCPPEPLGPGSFMALPRARRELMLNLYDQIANQTRMRMAA